MNNNIIVFPEYEELKNRVKKLKEQLCKFVFERDNLLLVECKNIEAQYMIELGSLEIAIYKIQCRVLRARRKLSIIQKKINYKEKVIESDIDFELDIEFEEYQKQLNFKIDKLNDALSYNKAEVLSESETKELKEIYYKVIKKLHPDLNNNITNTEIELFYKAVEAFDEGDIITMRIIAKAIIDDDAFEFTRDSIKELIHEIKTLTEIKENIKNSIDEIKSSFPYNTIDLLNDPKKLKIKQSEYKELIEQEIQMLNIYERRITETIRSYS